MRSAPRRVLPLRRITLVLLALLAPAAGTPAARAAEPVRQLATPVKLELQRGELIQRFDVEVEKGRITGLPEVPTPWRLKITTRDRSARIEAVAETGSSEFRAAWFTDFLEVQLEDGGSVILRIVTTETGEEVRRRLAFSTADGTLTLRPAPPAS